jgi:hypothetical protein
MIGEPMQALNLLKMFPDGRMNTDAAAEYIGCTRQTLAQWRTEKKGPAYVKRGRIFYYKEDIDSWLQELRKESGDD